MQYELVTESAELPAIVAAYRSRGAVAVDTEFARFNTYYPIVGLVQLYDGESCYLIDPQLVDLGPLADLLADENVVKVLHACSEDVEVFCDALGVAPKPIFDTQIAAALLDVGFSVSYQKLVQHYLDILVPKEETRSDWLQRPLTSSQLEYASLDVIHLLEVYELQMKQLKELGRETWVTEECSSLAEDIPTQIDPDLYFLKVKNLSKLDQRQLYTLQLLCSWRERKARERNLPRNRVIEEKALFQIAMNQLKDRRGFRDKAGITSRQLKFHGEELEELVASAQTANTNELPATIPKLKNPVSSKSLRALKQVVEDSALRLGVAPEMLAKRRHLEQLIRSENAKGEYVLPAALAGWRAAVIGEALLSEAMSLKT